LMPEPVDHDRIPEPVPPLPLPNFEYDDLEKGERIGTGGDANVYRATIDHNGYTCPVAVKQPRFEGTIQNRVVKKFETEAETWSRLNDHDNIVSVYEWGVEPLPWLGLEFMDGRTLNTRIGSLNIAEALWLSGRIAEGIRHGHRHGVAHLDIKPTNVLLRDTPEGKWKYPKVSDWGLAKLLLEHSNSIDGISPTYAAPEQFDTDEYGNPDDITDIYQLGSLVYALITGEPPFSGSSTAVMQGVLQEEPDPPSIINPAVPGVVDEVVMKALAKEKDDRYEGILPFRKELDRLFTEFVNGDTGVTAPSAAPSTEDLKDQKTERGPESQTVTSDSDVGYPSDEPSDGQRIGNNDSQFVSRRALFAPIGAGILGGGSWTAIQRGGNNDNSAAATVKTDTTTETPTPATDTPTPEPTTDTPTSTPTSTSGFGVVVTLTALLAASLPALRRD
jgi:serine/threonine-protein kinase